MKKCWKVFWGLVLIVMAVLLVLDACGLLLTFKSVFGELSLLAIAGGVLLTAYLVMSLIRGRLIRILFLLMLLFMLFEKNIAYMLGLPNENIINNWLLLFAVVTVAIGIKMIFPKRRHRGHGIHFSLGGGNAGGNLGHSVVYVDSAELRPDRIENNLGSCMVYFENPDAYRGDETLTVENNLGSLVLHVPESWDVKMKIESNLGSVDSPKGTHGDRVLYVCGENNLGSISVKFVKG